MNRKAQLLVVSVLMLGLQNVALSSPFPGDSNIEAYNPPAIETYAERHVRMGTSSEAWGVGKREGSAFPADSDEASYNLPAIETHAERQARMGNSAEAWGVGKRTEVEPHNPFPFGGGYVD